MGTWVKVESPTFMGSWTSKVQPSLKGTTVGFIESIPVAVADTLFLCLLFPPHNSDIMYLRGLFSMTLGTQAAQGSSQISHSKSLASEK